MRHSFVNYSDTIYGIEDGILKDNAVKAYAYARTVKRGTCQIHRHATMWYIKIV